MPIPTAPAVPETKLSLYDAVMKQICPPLMSENFEKTMISVQAMPQEEQEKRLEAYEWGFQVFDAVLEDLPKLEAAEAREHKARLHAQMRECEEADRKRDVTDAARRLDSLSKP